MLANNLRGKYKGPAGLALQIATGSVAPWAERLHPSSGVKTRSGLYMEVGLEDDPFFSRLELQGQPFLVGLKIIFKGAGLVAVLITAFTYKRINAARNCEELLQQQKQTREDEASA
ncbi:hypothetical protein BU15DRAFT_62229 [Melanogaster broomeanus]|nr:hypothetical protein BU15DRAFT_62229 [Melanogaster broomeanus]